MQNIGESMFLFALKVETRFLLFRKWQTCFLVSFMNFLACTHILLTHLFHETNTLKVYYHLVSTRCHRRTIHWNAQSVACLYLFLLHIYTLIGLMAYYITLKSENGMPQFYHRFSPKNTKKA